MAATYVVHITSAAYRSFKHFPPVLLANHRSFASNVVNPRHIKVIQTVLDPNQESRLTVAPGFDPAGGLAYIRIVIDIIQGSLTTEEKEALLHSVERCCLEYGGEKKAPRYELEIQINEIPAYNVLLRRPTAV